MNPNATALKNSSGCQVYDVTVNTSYGGFLSDPFYIFINTPWKTVHANDPNGGTWVYSKPYYDGYDTTINYNTQSLCATDTAMTVYDINEAFGDWKLTDTSYNWGHGPATSGWVSADPRWWDHINFASGPAFCPTVPCVPAPANPGQGPHNLVQYVFQSWYVGSPNIGSGALIQTDTLQRYLDSASQDQILTPARKVN